MDFEEYKRSRFSHWQKKIINVCWISSISIFITELIIFAIMASFGFLEGKMLNYPIIRILIPSGINFLATLICHLLKYKKIFPRKKIDMNLVAILNTVIISGVVATFHCFFLFLLVCTIIPFFLCTIFADLKLLKKIFFIDFGFVISSCISVYIDAFTGIQGLKIITFVCYVAMWAIGYFLAQTLVKTQINQIQVINDNYKMQTKLIEELKIEPMTQLYNKTCLEQCLTAYVRKFYEGKFKPSVVIIDIDHFKLVNDTYGHTSGDTVLLKLANIIKEQMGGSRHAFRFGGEEFVLVFETEPNDFVIEKIKSIKEDFCSCEFDFAPEKRFSFSAGISFMKDGMDKETWFNLSDSALYTAKNSGRNRIEIAESI